MDLFATPDLALPLHPRPAGDLLGELEARRARDPEPHGGRLFSLMYPTGRDDLEALVAATYERFLYHNALNPFRFPELAGLEREVVAMTGSLVHLPPGGGGTMTSGGSESILLSMLTNRGRARARGVARPRVLAPATAHPAYAKAAHYLDMEYVPIPVDDTWRADVAAAATLVDERVAVVVASAFTYPHGVLDPVADLAALAAAHGAGCHVDACIGGFVLPFLERLGHDLPPWDLRVPGVTEISVDIHKYGYAPKGASVILHRDPDWVDHQVFLSDAWPAGLYGSPVVAGARPGAPIAAAWVLMQALGVEGYTQLMDGVMGAAARLRRFVEDRTDLALVGDPVGPVLAMRTTAPPGGDPPDHMAVADAMEERGWALNRLTDPPALHLMLSPRHVPHLDALLTDLADALADASTGAARGRGGPVRYA